jgi:hypothetical protein
MGFKQQYDPDQPVEGEEELPGFLTVEEKGSLIDKGTTFSIIGARNAETTFGDRVMLDIEVKLGQKRTAESKTLSFDPLRHRQRARMLAQMVEWFADDGADPIEARLTKQGRTILLELV